MFDAIVQSTRGFDFVGEYLDGRMTTDRFVHKVDTHRKELLAAGLSEWQFSLLRRFPGDMMGPLCKLRDTLSADGIVGPPGGFDGEFETYRRLVSDTFIHLPNRFTSIFPEETRVAYELSRLIRPRSVVVAGSYYAYLAVWLVPGLLPDGRIICVDPDDSVCRVARANMAALGFSDRVTVVCDDAIVVLGDDDRPIDLLVVDAYGSREHRDSRRHGKAIYGPIVRAALPRMGRGSTIFAHNAVENAPDLRDFYEAVSTARVASFLGTTEHMGIFRL